MICSFNVLSQTNPAILSWLQNTTTVGSYYMKNNPTPISNNIKANVQLVRYSASNVYVSTNGIPTYPTGPFLDGNPSQAQSQNAIFKFPLNPQKNNGTPTATTGGNIGIFINGVALFDYRDGVSWRNSTSTLQGGPLGGMGDNIWNRDAIVAERIGFDCAKGHPAMGNYHHHQNPSAFKLDKNVISNICSLYDADGLYTINQSVHSPLIGFAYDGFPIYGAYGYKNTDGTGGVVRMKSSFQLRAISVRTHYADGTDVLDGPAVNTTYPLGYFREDYVYVAHSEPDYLDDHNGRFCITPDYPNGTYAYFCTVDDNWNSAYLYVVGPTFYGVKSASKVPNVSEPTTVYTPPVPNLDITPQSITINAAATSVNITITSNLNWTLTSNQSWAIPSKSQGSGNAGITVQCAENTQVGTRSAIITCSATGVANKYVTITQKDSLITLSVNKQSLLFPAYPSSDSSVIINSNGTWGITTSHPWIHVTPIQGTGNDTLIVNVDEQVDTVQRSGTISVQTVSGTIKTISVTQLDSVHIPAFMVADIDTVVLGAENASSYSFKLISNTPWKATSPASWLTVKPDSGSANAMITATAKANTGKSPRSTVIVLQANAVKEIIIPVIQKDTVIASLTLAADTVFVPAKAREYVVAFSSNIPWKAVTQTPWIHMKLDTGKTDAILSFSTDLNDSQIKRSGFILIKGQTGISRTLTIVQADTILKPSTIEDLTGSFIHVFPNPSQDILIIQAQSIIRENVHITMHDINGKFIAETTLMQGSTIAFFDCSTIYSGTYYLSIKGQGQDLYRTININHQ
jgi:hypothetical protein